MYNTEQEDSTAESESRKVFRSLNRTAGRFHLCSALIKRDSRNLFKFKAIASMENVFELWVCAPNDILAVRPVVVKQT